MAMDISTEFIRGIAKLDERLIILMDMDRLMGMASYATMIESTQNMQTS